MKTNEEFIPKALRDVWEWKDAVYQDTKDMTTEEKLAYFHEGLESAAKLLGKRIVKTEDGNYILAPDLVQKK